MLASAHLLEPRKLAISVNCNWVCGTCELGALPAYMKLLGMGSTPQTRSALVGRSYTASGPSLTCYDQTTIFGFDIW